MLIETAAWVAIGRSPLAQSPSDCSSLQCVLAVPLVVVGALPHSLTDSDSTTVLWGSRPERERLPHMHRGQASSRLMLRSRASIRRLTVSPSHLASTSKIRPSFWMLLTPVKPSRSNVRFI